MQKQTFLRRVKCFYLTSPFIEPASYRSYLLQEIGPVRVNQGWGTISFQPRVA
jgi:hypothetical protein